MRDIITQVKRFVLEYSKLKLVLIVLWAALLVYFNYELKWYYKWVRLSSGWVSFLLHSAIYYISYIIPVILALLTLKKVSVLRNKWFWIISVFSPLVFAFTSHYDYFDFLELDIDNNNLFYFHSRVSFWLSQVIIVCVFTFIIWYFKDRKVYKFYGLGSYKGSLMPYYIMLLIMLVPILLAGNTDGFLHTYPRIKSIITSDIVQLSWFHYILYEMVYAFNFIGIEVFFRGFLIISMVNLLGKEAILPMACFYVAIHFGKPMGECISSFFGGSLLGIISYHNNSIKGGLIAHIGIAWLMELSGALGTWIW